MGSCGKRMFALLLAACVSSANGQVNNVAGLSNQVSNSANTVNNLQNRMGSLQRTVAGTANNPIVAMDATLSGGTTKCGPQTITGWTETLDYYYTTAVQATQVFNPSTGTFTPPVNGYYKICSSARFQKGGNAVETDWRTTGVCTNQQLATTDSITLRLQSGGSSDCVQETNYLYSRLSIHMISCLNNGCT